jgi:hypothetical protein
VNDINTSVGIEKKNDPNGPISAAASVDPPFAIAGVARRMAAAIDDPLDFRDRNPVPRGMIQVPIVPAEIVCAHK